MKGGDHNVSTAALCVLLSGASVVILLTSNKYGFSWNFENSRAFLKDFQNLTCACLHTKSKVLPKNPKYYHFSIVIIKYTK